MRTQIKRVGLCAVAVLQLSVPALAQQPAPPENGARRSGRIIGRVVDAQTGSGLSAVTIQLVGTPLRTVSGLDGRFLIANVPAGVAALRLSTIGYATKTVTEVEIGPGAVIEQNISMELEAIAMAAIEVTAAAERGSVNRALDFQRTAAGIVNAVTAEQITRSPDGDAAAAVQRVSGVTVQDGRHVVVRGLGERYTTASLNGARIPSPEPERKIVPLDLFPSALLETITTSKTFTPDQPGDFSGARVDIRMREFPASRTRVVSTSFGWNTQATGKDILSAPGVGGEWVGFAQGGRAVPANIAAAGRFAGNVTQDQMNGFISSFRNVWSAKGATGTPTGSVGLSLGGADNILGRRIGYVLSGTYSYGQEIRSHEVRALAQPSTTGEAEQIDRYAGMTARSSVLWGGVLNASTLFGNGSRLALNTTYNRSAENEAREEAGTSAQFGDLPLDVTRLRYIERAVGSAQLLGEHELGRQRVAWAVTGSRVERNEPDRSEFVYSTPSDPSTGQPLPREWFASAAEGAVRTFGELAEHALETKADYRLDMGASRQSYLKLGALYRNTQRDASNFAYSIIGPTLPVASRRLRPEEIFDGRFAQPGMSFFQLKPISQGGSYTAEDRLMAGYAMVELGVTSGIRVLGGARIERSDVEVVAEPTLGSTVTATPSLTDVLPSLAVNISLADNQKLRFSASQTVSRPEYRELAPVLYREVIGAENVRGNEQLIRTQIRNFDARWELYPSSGEVVSVALFAKRFADPIERVYLGNSGSSALATFANAERATNYGVELEARKRFGFLAAALENVTGFANATFMKSEIEIGAAAGASRTNDRRPMVGQSPYVVNAGLTYSSSGGATSVTALYNVFGERIVSAAVVPLPDVYEQPRHQLDMSLRFPIVGAVAGKLDVKNLLDSPYETRQGVVVREYYKAGRVISAGLSWRL